MDYLPHIEKFMPWGVFCSLVGCGLLLLAIIALVLALATRRRREK